MLDKLSKLGTRRLMAWLHRPGVYYEGSYKHSVLYEMESSLLDLSFQVLLGMPTSDQTISYLLEYDRADPQVLLTCQDVGGQLQL